MGKVSGAAQPVSAQGMARIRVYTRTGAGRRVPMVGLISQAKLAQIRERFQLVWNETGTKKCRVTARVQAIDEVEVQLEGESDPVKGRRLLLGVRVRPPSRRTQSLRASLGELILEAERVLDAPQAPAAAPVPAPTEAVTR